MKVKTLLIIGLMLSTILLSGCYQSVNYKENFCLNLNGTYEFIDGFDYPKCVFIDDKGFGIRYNIHTIINYNGNNTYYLTKE